MSLELETITIKRKVNRGEIGRVRQLKRLRNCKTVLKKEIVS